MTEHDEQHPTARVREPGQAGAPEKPDTVFLVDEVGEEPLAASSKPKPERLRCLITGQDIKRRKAVRLDALRPALAEMIRDDYPEADHNAVISPKALAAYRTRYITEILTRERGELSNLEQDVIESLQTHETLAENTEEEFTEHRTFGEKLADHVASFGGSWVFILSFGFFLVVWMMINIAIGEVRAFDPYPFILLNLVLSCLAAIQAPIIMMSQKRQEAKDRLRSENDYRVNLKAELEIRHLHEKIDHLLNRQWERLAEIQQIQIEILSDLADAARRSRKL